MQSLNRVYLIGHLGSQPELRTSSRGQSYVNLNLATNKRWKNREEDSWESRTHWHTVTVWGKEAETCGRTLKKGQPVFVEGHLAPYTPPGEREDGKPNFPIQAITADRVRFWPPKANEDAPWEEVNAPEMVPS